MSKLKKQHQSLLPQSQKFPNIFRWKTTALIILILIAAVGVIDICLKIYISSHPDPTANISFINGIVDGTRTIENGDNIQFMLTNMLKADPKIYFSSSHLLFQGFGSNFSSDVIKDHIFRNQSKNLLFIFQVKKNNSLSNNLFGIFVAGDFPIPNSKDYNQSIDYYTFEYGSQRLSLIFSFENNQYLVMNGSHDDESLSQLEKAENVKCKTYYFSQSNNYFGILSLFQATLDSNPVLSLMNLTESLPCYGNVETEVQLTQKLVNIIGFDIASQEIIIQQFQVYYLNT